MANRYDERFQQLKSYMESQDMELLMITSPINIYYFTGFFSDPHERFMALFYSKEGEASLFVPSLDKEIAQQHAVVSSIIPISDTDNPYEFVKKKWSASVTSLGIEKKIMNVYQSERMKECFPQAQFADEIHEAPSIHSQNETRMETGMLFTIEPGIYISDIGGVRIEDNVYIRPDGEVEVLTSYPKQLIQL